MLTPTIHHLMEIPFTKYKKRGVGYHWDQIGLSLLKHNAFVTARFRLVENLVQSRIKGRSILDVGCGDGVLIRKYATLGAIRSHGIDTSSEAIAFARKKCSRLHTTGFTIGSAYTLPFPDNSFDFVISSEVVEHLESPHKMLKEIRRVWSGKGAVIITTPVRLTKKPLDPEHIQEFYKEDFLSLITSFFPTATCIYSHPIFWKEFQQKLVLGKPFGKILLNIFDILFHINPFLQLKGWNHYAIQTAIVEK